MYCVLCCVVLYCVDSSLPPSLTELGNENTVIERRETEISFLHETSCINHCAGSCERVVRVSFIIYYLSFPTMVSKVSKVEWITIL